MKRPDIVKDEHLEYLDKLRESGTTNMFGASVDLADDFYLDKKTARAIWSYWAKTFGDKDR